ncbi:sugar phosphate isomerase/epimerase family protein [Streptomyces kronopolitis]|uniref:sugar phosphate isomerase/epimerase family protein n=1 Tax=Streptomyces kronopolitis TaxID=1612435 RepID=UPI0034471B7B
MTPAPASTLVLNPDELGPDPILGMDLAVELGVDALEIRSAEGTNAILLGADRLRHIRSLADERELRVAALASPLWKWCLPKATPGRVDSFGFATQVPPGERLAHVERALEAARILGAPLVRVFSHLKVGGLTESFVEDPLLPRALALAEQAEVRLLIENEPVCTVADTQSLLTVLERFHDAGLGLWLDLGNLHEVGQAEPATVEALAPYTHYVHIKDYQQAADGSRRFCPAGTGSVPYDELLPRLGALRPALPYALETHVRDTPAEALAAGSAYLRAALAKARP